MAKEQLTDQLWQSITGTYQAILEHPFIKGLGDGSLDQAAFEFYIVQDALYLSQYARALSIVGARAPEADATAMFSHHSFGAIEVERSLHAGFFESFGLSPADIAQTEMAPTNLAYTSYLLATCYGGSFSEALGAVLPCYWIYWEVGKELIQAGSSNPLYQRWIDTYGGEDFASTVQDVLALTNRIGEDLTEQNRVQMTKHFQTTSRYEWMFWDMGYRRERWRV